MPNEDGSMTENEYKEAAAKLRLEQAALNQKQRELDKQHRISQLHRSAADNALRRCYRTAMLSSKVRAEFQKSNEALETFDIAGADPCADLAFGKVHNAPGTPKIRRRVVLRGQAMSEPFMKHYETGRYPTVEDHLQGRSPIFRIHVTETGDYVYEEITQEQLDELRSERNRGPVR